MTHHLHTSEDIALHLQLAFGLIVVVKQKKFASSLPRACEIDQYDCSLKGRSQGGVPKGDPRWRSPSVREVARHPFKILGPRGPRARPLAGRPVTNICAKHVFTHFVHNFCKHVLKTFSWLM